MDGKRAALALLVSLVVACGGAAPATTGGATASSGGASTAPTAAAATSARASAAVTPAANQPNFADVLAAAKLSQYKITYKITASGGGAESLSGDQTWYFKPPRSRFDFTTSAGGQKTTMSFFTLPE